METGTQNGSGQIRERQSKERKKTWAVLKWVNGDMLVYIRYSMIKMLPTVSRINHVLNDTQ